MLDLDEIDAVIARRGRFRGAPLLRSVLVPWRRAPSEPRLRSRLEARLLPLIGAACLPAPLCNHEVLGMEVDFLWPRQKVIVETDGAATHGTRVARERDHGRDLELKLAGYRVLRITWRQLDEAPQKPMTLLAQMLGEQRRPGR